MTELKLVFSQEFSRFSRKISSGKPLIYPLTRRTTVKDIIESVGVPHTEIGGIRCDGLPVDFRHIPIQSAVVTIMPVLAPFDVTIPSLLRPAPLSDIRFIADVNVGKLAVLMRMVGLDTEFNPEYGDDDIACCAEREKRIVLTKDIGLLKRRRVEYARYVRSVYPDDQLREVIDFFGLAGPFDAFSLCIRCNSELTKIEKSEILHRLEPKTRKYFNRFKICSNCDRIYWKGSHLLQMKQRLLRAGVRFLD